jgi:uncharacterized damage-inducible protein DinB
MNRKETAQQYSQRILSNVGHQEPWEVLESTARRLRELTSGRSGSELRRSPEPGRWSVAEILAHLADAEIAGAWRFRSVLAQDAVPLAPFDQNAWANAFRYEQVDPQESIALFDVNRKATLALLRRVDPARHDHHGMHAERGKETITHMIRLYAGHDLNHLRQIEGLLSAAT